MEVKTCDIVLCEFYFSDLKTSKNRPVLVFKDNLPYDDFIAIPISSKIEKLQNDEILLDKKSFTSGSIPVKSKLMIRKTFVVSKQVIIKKYGTIDNRTFEKLHKSFCEYFACSGKKI